MKRSTISAVLVTLLILATHSALSQSKATAVFDKLKSLAGDWEAKGPDGAPVRASYNVVSAESAVLETLHTGMGHQNMVTVYHLDGDNLMMTHYCAAQNQPRMRAKSLSGEVKKIDFAFVDATNLAKPTDGHMHRLVVMFVDSDHFTQEWTFAENGKEMPQTFAFERKK